MQKRHQNDTVFARLLMKSSSSCLFLFFPLHASFLQLLVQPLPDGCLLNGQQ